MDSEAIQGDAQAATARQMRSAVTMLRSGIEQCPEEVWLAGEPNATWHIAYHALFYTHFYLAPGESAFVAWEKHRPGVNHLGERCADPGTPYTKADLLAYADFCLANLEAWVRETPLDGASGFPWLAMTRLETHLYNLRHLAHHEGQIADRLRQQAAAGMPWVR